MKTQNEFSNIEGNTFDIWKTELEKSNGWLWQNRISERRRKRCHARNWRTFNRMFDSRFIQVVDSVQKYAVVESKVYGPFSLRTVCFQSRPYTLLKCFSTLSLTAIVSETVKMPPSIFWYFENSEISIWRFVNEGRTWIYAKNEFSPFLFTGSSWFSWVTLNK